MTDKFELSRRKVLGGLGTIGVASVGAGLGTTAFFSDEESFTNNNLTAGELDLKIDWEEHYSDWSDDEAEGISTISMEPGDGLWGFPRTAPDAERSVYVSDPEQFMVNTAIEAFPDQIETKNPDDANYDALRKDLDDGICDINADLRNALNSPYRTQGTFGDAPNPQTTESGDPLINIEDVKPGDFGEVTYSFHLCGNPGYVWLNGALRVAKERGHTEPERKDTDEEGGKVELLDAIRAAFWYDTGKDGIYGASLDDKDTGEGDNIFRPAHEKLLPFTGSLRSVLMQLEDGMFPLHPEPVTTDANLQANGDGSNVISGDPSSHLAEDPIVTKTDSRFQDGPGSGPSRNYQCADYEQRLNVGDIVGSEVINGVTVDETYCGCTKVTVNSYDSATGDITLTTSGPVKIVSIKGGNQGENVYVFSDPVTLNQVNFTTPTDAAISNIDVCCPVNGDDGNGGNGDDRCFEPSTTAYIGFEWWLPVDHANEIQTDKVAWDVGFYTEQCRHNDGKNPMGPE